MDPLSIAENCRACQMKTQRESQMFIFATTNLPDIYQETTSLDIHENDGLPRVLCCTCYGRLLEAYNFRKMCSAAALHFQQILSMDIPEEKYTPPEHPQPEFMDATLDIKAEPEVSYSPNSDLRDDDSHVSNESHRVLDPGPHDENTRKTRKKSPQLQKIKQPPGKPKLECGICNSQFHRKSQLEMHIWKKHLGLKPSQCKICSKEFKTSTLLRMHLNTHEAMGDIQSQKDINQHRCEICGIESVTAYELKRHVSTHKKKKKWCCVYCPYKSVTKESLKLHVKTIHQGVKDFHCPRCEKSFTTAGGLKAHMFRHEDIKNHVCTVCGVRKVTGSELNSHMKTHSTNTTSTKEKVWSCEFCLHKFSLRENLLQHVKVIHHGIKDHHCSVCKKSFGTADTLKNHMMRHTGERPHGCSICPKRFITPQQLKIHMKIHSGEKISCEFCQYKTIYRTHLRRHVEFIHQGVRDYPCNHCNKSFGAAIALRNHVMTHTGEKPHACSKCGKRFLQSSTLKKHMETHLKSKRKTKTKKKSKSKINSRTEFKLEPKTESYLFD